MSKDEKIIIYRNILAIIYLVLILIFTYMSLESGLDSIESSGKISNFICFLFNVNNTKSIDSFIRKFVGHFSFFCLFGTVSTFLYMTFYKWSYLKQILINFISGIIYILMTEFIFQLIAINRGPSFIDCLIDFLGFSLFSLIIYLFYYLYKIYKNKNLEENKKFNNIILIISGIIYSFLIIFYIIVSLFNSKESQNVSNSIGQVVVDITPGVNKDLSNANWSLKLFIRKAIGHFGYFFLIGFFSYIFYNSIKKYNKKIMIILHLSLGILFAIFTEFVLENIGVGRNPSIKDVITDSLGFLISSLFMYLAIYLIKSLEIYNNKHKRI